MATKKIFSKKNAASSSHKLYRAKFKGAGRSRTDTPDSEVCPICWSKEFKIVTSHWEYEVAIFKCLSCSHHSSRTFLQTETNIPLIEPHLVGLYETGISKTIYSLFVNKINEDITPRILYVFPPTAGLINRINRELSSDNVSIRDRVNGVTNRKINADHHVLTDMTLYDGNHDIVIPNNDLFKLHHIPMGYEWKSIVSRPRNIQDGLKKLVDNYGKFDMIVCVDILGQMIDPDLLVKGLINSCQYFMCIQPRFTSKIMEKYAEEFSNHANRVFSGEGDRKLNYPVNREKNLELFTSDQYQMFSPGSAYQLFKFIYNQEDAENLPKGKLRSLKASSIHGVTNKKFVIHNIPPNLYLDR